MAGIGDPVAAGLVESLAHPGGNVTGFTILSSDLSGKRLELLKEVVPVSAELSQLGSSGLEALDYLERKQRPPETWLNQQRALLETLKKPQVELRFAIAPSIAKLVNLTASLP